ncbi:MAG: glycosyltransferase [Lachnospiraceae bacterium]|nr:glycosyltransferase [Lachnospiraceae bacterium]
MKVLWLCNIVLPDFSQEFGIKKNPIGGWMTGMLHELEKREDVDISLCFPIYDPNRKKDGEYNGHKYYTFLSKDVEKYDNEMINVFQKILEVSNPDIIHIWGTEYPHTRAMLMACKSRGILDKTVVNVQGLAFICATHYLSGIPEDYQTLKIEGHTSIKEKQEEFEQQGIHEIESLKMIKHVIGRTDWDQACVKAINPQVQYHVCNEILRDIFYEYKGRWKFETCQKYNIFVSQASYTIKGFHYLLKALPIVIRQFPETHVYVAGRDMLNSEQIDSYGLLIKSLIEELNLEGVISFLGKLDGKQMVEQYLKANVFVSASMIENESNSLSEAKILGVPSIASYVGGVCNRVESGKDGFLYPYDEPALLAYYICKVFENKDKLCEKFSFHSVESIMRYINPKINSAKNLEIYRKIL